jgi:hypothetical protein
MKRIGLVFAAVLSLSACREEARTATDYSEATEQNSTSALDTAVRPAAIIPNPPDTFAVDTPSRNIPVNLALAPTTRPPLMGNAILKANGWSSIVTVRLQSQVGGGTHEGFVHTGTCQKLGPTVTDLHPVSTDSLGKGAAASFIDIPLDTLRAKPHALTYGRGGRPHACGNIL